MGLAVVADPRPDLTTALEGILNVILERAFEDTVLNANDILVVGAGAHGYGVASIRPLRGCGRVVVNGHRRLMELALRPRFFLEGDGTSRLATLIHELLHLDPDRVGALRESYRHQHRTQDDVDAEAGEIAASVLLPEGLTPFLGLAHDGEVLLRHWRHRPIEETADRIFGDDDVFLAPIRMTTPDDRRGGWW